MLFMLTMPELQAEREADRIEELIARMADGDIEAMAPLYDLVRSPVYAYALSLLRDPHGAEDVLHDCCLRVLNAAGGYVPRGKPMAFIMTVTRNLCYDRLAEASRHVSPEPAEWETLLRTDDVPTSLAAAEWLNTLSEADRQIVVLHVLAGFKHRETAEFMGMPTATVITRYSRAIKALRKHIIRERMEN